MTAARYRRTLAARLRPSLAELSRFTADELLAAGKLAGDPQGLLLQAEREMAGVLSQLDDYRAHADHPRAADYQRPCSPPGSSAVSSERPRQAGEQRP